MGFPLIEEIVSISNEGAQDSRQKWFPDREQSDITENSICDDNLLVDKVSSDVITDNNNENQGNKLKEVPNLHDITIKNDSMTLFENIVSKISSSMMKSYIESLPPSSNFYSHFKANIRVSNNDKTGFADNNKLALPNPPIAPFCHPSGDVQRIGSFPLPSRTELIEIKPLEVFKKTYRQQLFDESEIKCATNVMDGIDTEQNESCVQLGSVLDSIDLGALLLSIDSSKRHNNAINYLKPLSKGEESIIEDYDQGGDKEEETKSFTILRD